MSPVVRPLRVGDHVRVYEVDHSVPVERYGELGVVTGISAAGEPIVHCDDGFVVVLGYRYRARIMTRLHDDTGLSTGRWRVRRRVHVWAAGRAVQWDWVAEPIPAPGVLRERIPRTSDVFDCYRHGQAVEYAAREARENLR
ncbi:hypothetical protein [Microbacterium karelineae]|uniref:hypothetical protein n=1 Tax=Microbacterium karelineae TaxID=2654283 RepID=UPI0012E9DDA8|nr:hypothetical protein [Microbacterium karelineae]